MTDPFDPPGSPADDPLARSRALNRSALGAATGTPAPAPFDAGEDVSPQAPALPDRLQAIRMSLDLVPSDTGSAPNRMREAGAWLTVALAALPHGERRRFARWPCIRPCVISLDGRDIVASTLDIGAGGVMLAPLARLAPGDVATATLALSADDRSSAIVMVDRDGVGHLAFDPASQDAMTGYHHWLRACATSYKTALWQTAALANEIEALFEAALRTEAVSLRDLLVPAGAQPELSTPFDAALADLLARTIPVNAELAYAAVVDSHGHVVAEATGPGETMLRRGRRVRDTVTLRAARFSTGPLVQTYRRLPGREPEGVVSDVSAPILVRGRRWGCVQTGRNPGSFDAE